MNNSIFPCLWFDGDAEQAAQTYCEIFGGKIIENTPVVININFFGQKFMLLNGGPHFQKNASVSFMILCETDEEVDQYWNSLSNNGLVLMELGEYPWSKKYGWIRDQFSVTWQVYLGEKQGDQKIVPTLMFLHQNNGKAMKAMEFYTNIFPNSKIGNVLKYGEGIGNEDHEIPENVQHAHFVLNHYDFFCMDNSYNHQFDFSPAISLVVLTADQEETDDLWNALISEGGEESRCGWLKDQFGLSWQIVPKRLLELMNGKDREQSKNVMEALLKMNKILISDLEDAAQIE